MQLGLWIAFGVLGLSAVLLYVLRGKAGVFLILNVAAFGVCYVLSERFGPPWLHWIVIALGLGLIALYPKKS